MQLVRAENLSNVSSENSWDKQFWGKNYKQCQHWAMTSIAYRKEMRVVKFVQAKDLCSTNSWETTRWDLFTQTLNTRLRLLPKQNLRSR